WADGTSNQYIVGEKHVSKATLNGCCDGTDAADQNLGHGQDGSFLFDDGSWREYSTGRSARHNIGKGPNDIVGMDASQVIGFGSWHAATFNMLKGDGSVAGVVFTQDWVTRTLLACPADGTVVSNQ